VLEVIADRTPVLIEMKSDSARPGALEGAVGSVVSAYPGRAAVMSWNVQSMVWMRRFLPAVPRGLVMTSLLGGLSFSHHPLLLAAHLLPVIRWADADFLAHDIRHLPSRRSAWMRRHGRPVVTWTVRTRDQLACARAHADAPVFEGAIERLIALPATPL
jgi:glycerophosphoryl diester phosphodiesterase